MSRKPLDLDILNKALDQQKNPNWDRATQRAYQIANSMVSDIDEFDIVEIEADEVLIVAPQATLPSDEEIFLMKQELAERDRIEMEKQVAHIDRLPWWHRLLQLIRIK